MKTTLGRKRPNAGPPPNALGLSPDQEKQHLRGDQVFPGHIASSFPLENTGLILSWTLQASTSSLLV